LADTKSILITGCSSGIGLACATGLKARGYRVFATARKAEDLARLDAQGLEPLYLDYREPKSVEACAAEVSKRAGGKLYALFNNGAYGQPGALEDITREAMDEQFQTNVIGWHHLTRACLPLLRANGEGRIVQNSSVLGLVVMKWRGPYNATKFAVEGMTDTLRLELRGTGIKVSLIEPGPIFSDFQKNALAAFNRHVDVSASNYRAEYKRHLEKLEGSRVSRFKLPPEAVLEKLVHALESPRPKIRYYVTFPSYLMATLRRLLPYRLLDVVSNKASG
jgi:NAD(P)-dependent dehydrogenase (short-subunit alcohol dehydrogenase family)